MTLRQEQSRPILETIKEWLDKEVGQVLPKSPMAEAIGYALNHWKALERYLEASFLELDTGASERGLRPGAVGRHYADPKIMRSRSSHSRPHPGCLALR